MSSPHSAEWSYAGDTGPERWACLSDENRLCGEGVEQSPVNISGCVAGDEGTVQLSYLGEAIQARNTGHTTYLDFGPGNELVVDGRRYELLGVHYHSPGEHQVDGESFAAELHLVHQDAEGNLAVVGLLFRAGGASSSIQAVLDAAPETGDAAPLERRVRAIDFVPARRAHYGYRGSLTTPPCSEGVRWLVMQAIGTVSAEQVARLQGLTGGPNNRPVQPIGNRTITAGYSQI